MASTVSTSDWIKGITLSVAASLFGGASKLAIRKSWLLQQQQQQSDPYTEGYNSFEDDGGDERSSQRPPITSTGSSWLPLFLRGCGMFGMSLLNPLCGVLAMNYASPSITAPFSGLTLVWIILLSGPILKEPPKKLEIVAATFIVIGEVVVATFGDHLNDDGVSVMEVRNSYLQVDFLVFMTCMMIFIVILVFMMMSSRPILKQFAWGISGGTVTGFQNFLKDSLTLIKADEPFPWFGYLLISLALLTALSGLLLLMKCLELYQTTYSATMFVGAFVLSTSVMSIVHYHTFQHLEDWWNIVLYPTGLSILLMGVCLLLKSADQNHVEPEAHESTTYESFSAVGSVAVEPNEAPLLDDEMT